MMRQFLSEAHPYQNTSLSFAQFFSLLQKLNESSSYKDELNTLLCASLSEGSMLPTKVTYILGLDEGHFPRNETPSPLDLLKQERVTEYIPSKGEFDRGFFLEALMSCQERFVVSYSETPSPLVQEWVDQIGTITTYKHPPQSCDPSYFTSEDPHFRSFCMEEHALALSLFSTKPCPKPEQSNRAVPLTTRIELKELLRFVKQPVRALLKEKASLYFSNQGELKEDEDFTFSPLQRALILRSREEMQGQLDLLQQQGSFPQGTLGQIARHSMERKEKEQQLLFARYGIDSKEGNSLSFMDRPIEIGPYHLVGKIESLYPQGLLVYEKADFTGALAAYPAFLALHCCDEIKRPLFFGKEEKRLDPFFSDAKPLLQKIIELYLWTKEKGILILPDWVEPVFKKEEEKLQKKLLLLKEHPDEAVTFFFRNQPLPSAQELIDTLHQKISTTYQELYHGWF